MTRSGTDHRIGGVMELASECTMAGACGCAHILDCASRDRVRELAHALRGRSEELRARWEERLRESGERTDLAWSASDLARLLEIVAIGDTPLIANAILSVSRTFRDRAAPLHEMMAASQLLGRALFELGERRDPGLEAALRKFGWLHGTLVGVAYGATPGASQPTADEVVLPRAQLCGLVGASQAMRRLYGRIELAARGRETVLLTGESGVGKELVARAIHQVSGDDASRFVAVNCAALPRELMESELFGHRRGAFSGANADHGGLVRAAESGTLFLDEITELAPDAQAKLLRVIQERTIRAVGDVQETPVHVRIVAATNRERREALEGGQLRRDLYYRLQRMVIDVPPLRDRMSDVPLLVACFAERWRAAYDEPRAKIFTDAAIEALCAHEWPGNVRELENAVFAACLASPRGTVGPEDLPPYEEAPHDHSSMEPHGLSMKEAERGAIREALRRADGNKSLAARILGISRKQLYAKLRLYEP